MYLLYDLVLLLAAAVLIPYYLLRSLRYGKSRRGIRERLGYYAPGQLELLRDRQVIWLHAVSVGETRAARPLLKELRKQYPQAVMLLTNVTETGHAIALESAEADLCLFFPFDFSWVVRRALETIKPQLVVIVETEIWPNFTRWAAALRIPLALVNGRISDRSFPRYRFFRPLLKPLLACFSAFCMQSQQDSERIVQLGALPERVENTGNLKFDHELRELSEEEVAELKTRYRLPGDVSILTAGSTHAGEEVKILEAFQQLLAKGYRLALVLIPRHPERSREVAGLVANAKLEYRLRSSLTEKTPRLASGQVLLVDTLGEVLNLYATSDLIFVGGSLMPIGGHNPIEASLLGKSVLFGPHVHNFREISAKLIRTGAGLSVANVTDLVDTCQLLLDDPVRRRAMGQAGRTLIVESAGATSRTLERISRCLRR